MANDAQGVGRYRGPNHSPTSDMLDWATAHELGRYDRRPRLVSAHITGRLRQLARDQLAQAPATGWHDTGSGPGR